MTRYHDEDGTFIFQGTEWELVKAYRDATAEIDRLRVDRDRLQIEVDRLRAIIDPEEFGEAEAAKEEA